MFTIKNSQIYSSNGEFLKRINCPKRVTIYDLNPTPDGEFNCDKCDIQVRETDHMTEPELLTLLKTAPETCLKINPFNPIFIFE